MNETPHCLNDSLPGKHSFLSIVVPYPHSQSRDDNVSFRHDKRDTEIENRSESSESDFRILRRNDTNLWAFEDIDYKFQ